MSAPSDDPSRWRGPGCSRCTHPPRASLARSCSRFHALSWWTTVAGIKTLRMLDSVLGFSERACSCCASSSAGREEDVFWLKRLHGRLVDTLELFFNHDGCRSGCDAFRRNIDTVPCQTKNFTDSHTACKGRVDSQLQMGIIANIKCEKNRLGIPDFTFKFFTF